MMTNAEREALEKDVLFEAERAKRDHRAVLVKLERMGDKLEELGRALRNHPELVTPLPEADAPDYREALNLLAQRQEIIELCKELRVLHRKEKVAAQRAAALGYQ